LLASFDAYLTADSAISLPTFAEALEANKAMVYSIGWHFLRDRTAAEELAQEVFLQLHRNWSVMKSPAHIVHWLRRTASHRAIDIARKHKRHHEKSLEETSEPTTLERVHDTFLARYLERLVSSLPEKQRMVVILRYQEDMEIEEIARVLDMKTATVKTALFRALELLRKKAAHRLGEPADNAKTAQAGGEV
jgi:RNA polymerase sigma-70 factor (ECF subfamily)